MRFAVRSIAGSCVYQVTMMAISREEGGTQRSFVNFSERVEWVKNNEVVVRLVVE
jgi:hypothetical protein